MPKTPSWTPWRQVVELRDDVRTGELSLTEFAADLHDVMMQQGARPIYEDPARFFALTYPTLSLRELARDVALRLSGKSTKAIRQLEQPYGGGKTHTLVTLRHLFHDPARLPSLPAVEQFRSEVDDRLPGACVAALSFDKLDVQLGMEVLGPTGERRRLRQPWSVLAFQLAGADGLRALHAEGLDEEREPPPAEPLLAALLAKPAERGLGTLVLIDEVLMYAREKAAVSDRDRVRLVDFFQYLTQAAAHVDRCVVVASLLASNPEKSDALGKSVSAEISDIFGRQREEGVQPVQKEDVAEVMRRRFFTPDSIADREAFRPQVSGAVKRIAGVHDATAGERRSEEERFLRSYPFHPDLTDIFYSRWTQLERFQRTRGILRVFAIALRDAEAWDDGPLVGPGVLLPKPGAGGIAEAARELAEVATLSAGEEGGNAWNTVLEGELDKARQIQEESRRLRFREMEQAVAAVFLSSQPVGQKAHTPELAALAGATGPDRIELEKGLRRWTEVSWFLDDAEYGDRDSTKDLPNAWRLGQRPNLKQMHHEACANRVAAEAVEATVLEAVRKAKSLTEGAREAGARLHRLPESPQDIADDGEFHFVVLGPKAASDSAKPSAEAKRFVEEKASGMDRRCRNAVVVAVPSRDGLKALRDAARDALGWDEVRAQLRGQGGSLDAAREAMLASESNKARQRVATGVRQAWTVIVAADEGGGVGAFRLSPSAEPLFLAVKADARARIEETAIEPQALLPEGPYDLWREDEESRRVKTLVEAFAEDPALPRMIGRKGIRDTVSAGVREGAFVASLRRPDGSVRTWWRAELDESAFESAELEVIRPGKAGLTALDAELLAPGVLPDLWKGDSVEVSRVLDYFSGKTEVTVPRDGFEESLEIPKCPAEVVEGAIAEAVRAGSVWLRNGPASFQGEEVPVGVLTASASLRRPMSPLPVDRFTEEALPGVWRDGQANLVAVAAAIEAQEGHPAPWAVFRRGVENAVRAGWLTVAPESGDWPCEVSGAQAVVLARPSVRPERKSRRRKDGEPIGLYSTSADGLQDLTEALPDLLRAAAGTPVEFRVGVVLGSEKEPASPETVEKVTRLLAGVHSDFGPKPKEEPGSLPGSAEDSD